MSNLRRKCLFCTLPLDPPLVHLPVQNLRGFLSSTFFQCLRLCKLRTDWIFFYIFDSDFSAELPYDQNNSLWKLPGNTGILTDADTPFHNTSTIKYTNSGRHSSSLQRWHMLSVVFYSLLYYYIIILILSVSRTFLKPITQLGSKPRMSIYQMVKVVKLQHSSSRLFDNNVSCAWYILFHYFFFFLYVQMCRRWKYFTDLCDRKDNNTSTPPSRAQGILHYSLQLHEKIASSAYNGVVHHS